MLPELGGWLDLGPDLSLRLMAKPFLSPALLCLDAVGWCVTWKALSGTLTFLHEGVPLLLLSNGESY